jgi:hypothetical protein
MQRHMCSNRNVLVIPIDIMLQVKLFAKGKNARKYI